MVKVKWEKYDLNWLIEVAKEQIPEEKEIIKNLELCTSCYKSSRAYYYFVFTENPNEPNSEWQFDENIILHDKKNGEIVLNIIKDKRVGGIEFLKFL